MLEKRQVSVIGVKNTIEQIEKNIQKHDQKIYCFGEPVHNENVIKKLEEKGLVIKQKICDIPRGEKVIFRAHGVSKKVYEQVKQRKNFLIDLTCPKVIAIHKKIEQYTLEDYDILYLAEKTHPETIGSVSFAKDNIFVVEHKEDIDVAVRKIENKKVVVICQTTFSNKKFEEYVERIKQQLPKNIKLVVDKTICDATKLRQKETREIADKVELMIIIGGKKSANTNQLYEIAKEECQNAMLVETMEDLYLNYIKRFRTVGVMAGVSTPLEMIKEVEKILKNTEIEGYIYERSM